MLLDHIFRFRWSLLLVTLCFCLSCRDDSDRSAGSEELGAEDQGMAPVFETELWPGEGRPVIEAVGPVLVLRREPGIDAPVVARTEALSAEPIVFDSTRYQTIRPAEVAVQASAILTGRDFGIISYLSREAYYGSGSLDTTVELSPPMVFEYLQYRAEGTCFVRIGGRVLDAKPCPVSDTSRFRTAGDPETAWWVHAQAAGGDGWLLISDSTARIVGRTF